MRILVTTDQWSPDVVGGSARVAAESARALARRGHDVVVLAPSHPGRPRHEIESPGVQVHRALRRGPFPQTLADPLAVAWHAHTLRGEHFDVALAHQATGATGLVLARIAAPIALVFHASAVLEARFLRGRVGWASRASLHALDPALVAQERIALGHAAGVLVLSRFSRELVCSRRPSVETVVHEVAAGASDAFFTAERDPVAVRERFGIPPGILLFTARRLEPRMGVDVLVDALGLIDDERLALAVAGAGSLRRPLEQRIERLGLGRRVRLLGLVPEHELPALYSAADLFVLPTVAYEGFGIATVEALATGTPVLGTAVGATPEIVGSLGDEFVVPAAEPEALAGAIRSVVPLLGDELRRRVRTLANERYHWDSVVERWERALRVVAGVDGVDATANL